MGSMLTKGLDGQITTKSESFNADRIPSVGEEVLTPSNLNPFTLGLHWFLTKYS